MKNLKFVAFILVIMLLNGCKSIEKMKETVDQIKYTADPELLAEKGNEVKSSVTVMFPEKFFQKDATVEIKLFLKWEDGEKEIATKTVQGEKVEANNTPIKFDTGGSVTLEGTIDYEEAMRKSELVIRMNGKVKAEDPFVEIIANKVVAQGVLATSKIVEKDPKPIMMADNFKRIIPSTKEAEILYLINRAEVRKEELKKEEMEALVDFIKKATENEREVFKTAKISAYASPDGEIDLNTRLASKREKTAEDYLKNVLKKANVEQVKEDGFIAKDNTPEDWEGFKKLMQASNIKDKELILRVLSMYSDPVVREKEIKNISEAFEEIKDEVLPKLRRSVLKIDIEKVGYSDEELIALVNEDIEKLNLEELLFAAGLFDDFNKKLTIYQKAAEKHADCLRAINNVGYCYIKLGNAAEAKVALEKAAQIKAENPVVLNNLGVVALMQDDAAKAEQLFLQATNAGNNVQYNLGIIEIMKGNYEGAVQYLSGTNSFNQALALALAGKNNVASETLTKIENKTAKVYYLTAIMAARSANETALFDNLRTAIGKDASLKEYVKKDMEFAKYFENETFISIVG